MTEYSIWWYTLSAVAQTMAAITALFAVFSVYKLQVINKEINDFRGRVARYALDLRIDGIQFDSDLFAKTDEEMYAIADKTVQERNKSDNPSGWYWAGDDERSGKNLKAWVAKKKQVIDYLPKSLFFTALPIGIALSLLTVNPSRVLDPTIVLLLVTLLSLFGIVLTAICVLIISDALQWRRAWKTPSWIKIRWPFNGGSF